MIAHLDVQKIKLSELNFDDRNARKHDKKNLKSIRDSLDKFGQVEPLVVQKHTMKVIGGNGRLAAMQELGWKDCDVALIDIDDDKAKALGLVLNRSAELAAWDDDNLKELLSELNDSGWDIEGLGWDGDDLKDILDKPEAGGLTDEDDVPEVEQNVFGVKLGDIWQMGNHRMMCGDSTDKATVEKLMNGEKADMVFTDPPYGINEVCDRVEHVKTFKKQGVAKKGSYSQILGDDSTETASKAIKIARDLKADCNIFWGGNYYPLEPSSCWIVWDKRVEENQSDINSDCELAYVDHKSKASVRIFRHLWKGMIKASERGKSRVHPTQKPIALAEWCFENYGDPKSVLDLFLGSGSTLIACENTGRKCYGMELDPHYCSVIIKRWQDFTGKEAIKL